MHVVKPRLLYLLESFVKKMRGGGSFEQRASLSGFDLSVFQRVENIWKELQMWN